MSPEVWGRHLWFSIHFIALDYPLRPTSEDRASYQYFFENLWKVIPCFKCGQNYKKHLASLPLVSEKGDYLESRETLFAWTVALHNIVNKMLNKSEMTLDEARQMYREDTFPFLHNHSVQAGSASQKEQIQPMQIVMSKEKTSVATQAVYIFLGVLIGVVFTYLMMKRTSPIKYLKK